MTTQLPKYLEDLDPALYQPNPDTFEFLHATITQNDAELKDRVIETQKE